MAQNQCVRSAITCAPLAFLACLAVPSSASAQATTCEGHLATIEVDGRVSSGSKDAVRSGFHAGLPIRIGWSLDFDRDGAPDVAHWVDAGFLTEFEGEIFAQFEGIQRQQPTRGGGRVPMPPGAHRWTGLIATTGLLESHSENDPGIEPIRVRSQWCVDARASLCIPQWRLAYHHDTNGGAIRGSKAALFDAVRRGYPIRLAWGTSLSTANGTTSVEHAADPVFLTIMNGTDLVVQLPEHIAQASYSDADKAVFDKASVVWRGLMGTTGTFDAVLVDRATGAELRRLPQRARLAWFALAPDAVCAPGPIDLAPPGGVQRRSP